MRQCCAQNFICIDDVGASFHLKPLNLKHKGSLKCAQVHISLGLSMNISKQQTSSQVSIWIEIAGILCFCASKARKHIHHRYAFLTYMLGTRSRFLYTYMNRQNVLPTNYSRINFPRLNGIHTHVHNIYIQIYIQDSERWWNYIYIYTIQIKCMLAPDNLHKSFAARSTYFLFIAFLY